MRPIRLLATGAAGAAVLTMTIASPATAADTTATFAVTAGALTIAVPATADLGAGAPGTTITGSLGPVTVTDLRGANPAAWTATVSSTSFAAAGIPDIPVGAVTYTAGAATATAGDGQFTPANAGPLTGTAAPAFAHTAGTGSNSATWNPSLSIVVPLTATATTYTGTVTHLVA